jgi:hypothetical protein
MLSAPGPAMSVKNVTKKASPPMSATMAIQRAKRPLRRINNPAAVSDAARPIAPTRKGPTVVEATALLTRGFASAPSAVAPAMMITAMAIPVTPIRPPANTTRTSCTEPRTLASVLPMTLRIELAKGRNSKDASRMRSAPMRLLSSLSAAQLLHS